MVANPPDERFKEILSGSSLKNLTVEVKDVSNSYAILGTNCNRLRGASTRQKPEMMKEEYMKIPKDFYQLHNLFYLKGGCHVCKWYPISGHFLTKDQIDYL